MRRTGESSFPPPPMALRRRQAAYPSRYLDVDGHFDPQLVAPRLNRLPQRLDYTLIPAPLGQFLLRSPRTPTLTFTLSCHRPLPAHRRREGRTPCHHRHTVVPGVRKRVLHRIHGPTSQPNVLSAVGHHGPILPLIPAISNPAPSESFQSFIRGAQQLLLEGAHSCHPPALRAAFHHGLARRHTPYCDQPPPPGIWHGPRSRHRLRRPLPHR